MSSVHVRLQFGESFEFILHAELHKLIVWLRHQRNFQNVTPRSSMFHWVLGRFSLFANLFWIWTSKQRRRFSKNEPAHKINRVSRFNKYVETTDVDNWCYFYRRTRCLGKTRSDNVTDLSPTVTISTNPRMASGYSVTSPSRPCPRVQGVVATRSTRDWRPNPIFRRVATNASNESSLVVCAR